MFLFVPSDADAVLRKLRRRIWRENRRQPRRDGFPFPFGVFVFESVGAGGGGDGVGGGVVVADEGGVVDGAAVVALGWSEGGDRECSSVCVCGGGW